MEIRVDIQKNPRTGLRRDLTVQTLNVDFISETAYVLAKFNTYDLNDQLYTCDGLEWNINLKELFPESTNTLVDWRAYFGTPEFYNDLKLHAEAKVDA